MFFACSPCFPPRESQLPGNGPKSQRVALSPPPAAPKAAVWHPLWSVRPVSRWDHRVRLKQETPQVLLLSFGNCHSRLNPAVDMASLDSRQNPGLQWEGWWDWRQLVLENTLLDTTASPRCQTRCKGSADVNSWYSSSRAWAKPLSRKATGHQL